MRKDEPEPAPVEGAMRQQDPDPIGQLAAVLYGLRVAMVVTDLNGAVLAWNDSASALLDWPRAGPWSGTGRPAFLRGEPRWFQRLRAEALTGEGPAAALLRRRSAGAERCIRVAASAIHQPPDFASHLIFTLEDQTRARRWRHELRASSRRFDGLIAGMPDPVAIHQDRRIVQVNAAACRLLGARAAGDLLGRDVLDFVHPEFRELVSDRAREVYRTSAPAETMAEKLVRLDGTVIHAEVTGLPVLYRGAPAIMVIARDLTTRKRVEARLRISKERFRVLTEGVRDHAIIMLDAGGVIVSWNAAAERITGYRAHQAVRQHISTVMPAADEGDGAAAPAILADAVANARVQWEGWRVRLDGTRFWAGILVTTLYDPLKKVVGFAWIVRDLTERRETEHALRRSEENLRQAQKMEAVGRLAGGIAHDFNNLLTAIQGHAQFLLEDLDDSIPSHADAQEIKRAADRAAALTRQLLIFSRKQVLQPTVLDVNLVVRDMEKLFRRVIREDIALETQLAPDLREISGDPSQLEQVLMNLVVNARDAMPRGGVLTIRTRNLDLAADAAPLATVPPGRYVQIAVSDTGVGMDRETQAHIFEPFFTTKPEGQGTGLGLATVYGIVARIGGSIHVYSEPGRGSTLRILLPAAPDEAEPAAAPQPAELSRGWEAVLVVEDDASIRNLTSRALQGRGYSVLEAETGAEALRLAEEYDGPIDLVITDIVMPEMSGRRLAESVHVLHPSARVLFMSGFAPREVVRQGLVDAEAQILEKPFSTEVLARTVREVLDERG